MMYCIWQASGGVRICEILSMTIAVQVGCLLSKGVSNAVMTGSMLRNG